MKEITYSLREKYYNSNLFYDKLSSFTKNIEKDIDYTCGKYIKNYMNFLDKNHVENMRTELEYYMEILMIGVLWKNYINRAVNLKIVPKNILIFLSHLRNLENIKTYVDKNRGIMETIFLNKEDNKIANTNTGNFKKLIGYLEATGDFKEEIKRLKNWEEYFKIKNDKEIKEIISLSLQLETIFERKAKVELGIYTKRVNDFLTLADEKYKYREDYISCIKSEVEYHFNMVGAEIMNNAYKDQFIEAKEKRLLLPACMRAQDEKNVKLEKLMKVIFVIIVQIHVM